MAAKTVSIENLKQGDFVRITVKVNGEKQDYKGWAFAVHLDLESPGIEFCHRGYGDESIECPVHPQAMEFISCKDVVKIVKL